MVNEYNCVFTVNYCRTALVHNSTFLTDSYYLSIELKYPKYA